MEWLKSEDGFAARFAHYWHLGLSSSRRRRRRKRSRRPASRDGPEEEGGRAASGQDEEEEDEEEAMLLHEYSRLGLPTSAWTVSRINVRTGMMHEAALAACCEGPSELADQPSACLLVLVVVRVACVCGSRTSPCAARTRPRWRYPPAWGRTSSAARVSTTAGSV